MNVLLSVGLQRYCMNNAEARPVILYKCLTIALPINDWLSEREDHKRLSAAGRTFLHGKTISSSLTRVECVVVYSLYACKEVDRSKVDAACEL